MCNQGINFSGSSQQQKPSSTTQSTPPSKTDKLESEEEDDDDEILKERISELEERNKILFTVLFASITGPNKFSQIHSTNNVVREANCCQSFRNKQSPSKERRNNTSKCNSIYTRSRILSRHGGLHRNCHG